MGRIIWRGNLFWIRSLKKQTKYLLMHIFFCYMPIKETNLEEIVGKKVQLLDKFDNEQISLEGTIFTPNKIDYEFLYRIDLFSLGSVCLREDNFKINKEKKILMQTKPEGVFVYNPEYPLFYTLQDFELRNKYLNQVGL